MGKIIIKEAGTSTGNIKVQILVIKKVAVTFEAELINQKMEVSNRTIQIRDSIPNPKGVQAV